MCLIGLDLDSFDCLSYDDSGEPMLEAVFQKLIHHQNALRYIVALTSALLPDSTSSLACISNELLNRTPRLRSPTYPISCKSWPYPLRPVIRAVLSLIGFQYRICKLPLISDCVLNLKTDVECKYAYHVNGELARLACVDPVARRVEGITSRDERFSKLNYNDCNERISNMGRY